MNKKILTSLICLLNIVFLKAQDYIIISPHQLAVQSSTARLDNPKFSGSGLSQAFFRDNYNMNFSLFIPYNGLTDASLNTSSFSLQTPAFNWGQLNFVYADFRAENLNDPVFNIQSIQLGYGNMLFNHVLFSLRQKWNMYSWYSDNYKNLSLSNLALDSDFIYIIDGYNSIGLSFNNLLAEPFSSDKNDRPLKSVRLGYFHKFHNNMFDIEGGIISRENYLLKKQSGVFLNSEIHLNNKVSLATEYMHHFYNALGLALMYDFSFDNIHTQLTYGFRIDDSPMPLSSFRHAFGFNITLDELQVSKPRINPQLVYRDDKAPRVRLERISDYTVFINDDDSDFLRLKTTVTDDLSGLESLTLQISPEDDSSDVQYNITRSLNGFTLTDTIDFMGLNNSGQFMENGIYQVSILAADNAGNISKPYSIPFRVLSHRNDMVGPEIKVEFDSSTVFISPGQKDYLLTSKITIDEKSNSSVRWSIQLFRSTDDSSWIRQKPVSGSVEVYNHDFQWLLRKKRNETINGSYKLKTEAWDELNNYSMMWSSVKSIIDTVSWQQEEQDSRRQEQSEKPAEPAIVYIPEAEAPAEAIQAPDNDRRRVPLKAAYNYKNREVTLTNFKFVPGQSINIKENQQSLSVIGFYLQDLPKTKLIIEYPAVLEDIPGFEDELRAFFSKGFNVASNRLQFNRSVNKRIYFIIAE